MAPLASVLFLLWAWGAHAQIAVARVAASISTGNQDLTAPGVGWTPRAAILLTTYATADATAAAGAFLSIGLTDCSVVQRTALWRSGDNVGISETAVWGANDMLIQVLNEGNTALDGEGALVGCIAGGVRINWTDALAQGYFVHLVLFGPQTVSQAKMFSLNNNGTLDGSVDVTAPGFQPHDVFVTSTRQVYTDALQTPNAGCVGVGSASAQGGIGWGDVNGSAATNIVGGTGALYACNTAAHSAWPDISLELHSFDAQGFSVATRRVGGGIPMTYLALRYQPGVRSWTGGFSTPTSPTTATATAPGFAPEFVMLLQTGAATLDTEEDDADAGYYGVSLLTAAAQYNLSWATQDAADITNAQSLSDNQAINLPNHAGTALFAGTLSSLAAPGFALTFSATDTTARQWYGWAISGSPPSRGRSLSWW